MNRPKIICHMETSLDGKIMGKYLWLPGKEGAEDSFYTALGHYEYQAQLLGRTTIDDNYTLYRKPEVNEKAPPVPEGDFLAEGAKLGQYLIAMDSHGRLAWEDHVSDGDNNGAEAYGGQVGIDKFRPIGGVQGHPVSFADPHLVQFVPVETDRFRQFSIGHLCFSFKGQMGRVRTFYHFM